jgi:homoserine kinase
VTTFEFDVPATCAHLGPGFGVLGLAVDLALKIRVEESKSGGFEVVRDGVMSHDPKDPRHDGILRGLNAASERFSIKLPGGLAISARNDIPAFSGLGTNSAAFAAGLGIACRYTSQPPTADALLDLLVELGGTPAHGGAALYGGLVAVCPVQTSKDELRHLVLRYALADSWHFVIARPDHHIGAPEAVRLLPASLPHGVIKRTSGRLLGLLHALSVGDDELLKSCMVDEVHVPYRRKLVPGVDQALRAIQEGNIAGATISGAGPALVLITQSEESATVGAKTMQTAFDEAAMPVDILHLRGSRHGAIPDDPPT